MQILISWLFRLLYILPTAFWIWMIVDCVREEEDRSWYFVLFFTYILGAFLYLFLRKIPRNRGHILAPSFLKKILHRKKLMELEAAAKRIGNAYQFLNWGNALYEANDYKMALMQYEQALMKDKTLNEAWWMKARCESQLHNWEKSRDSYARLFELDPVYAYGEATLNYGRILIRLNDREKAQVILEKHLEHYRLPEALYLLSGIYLEMGQKDKARDLLETLVTDVQSAPLYHVRKQKKWMHRAKLMLVRL